MKTPQEPKHSALCEMLMDHQSACVCGAYETPEGKAWLERERRAFLKHARKCAREVASWPAWKRGGT